MIYHKFVEGREVFSDCKRIVLEEYNICNPSAEQIAEAGWVEYNPPQPQYEPQLEPDMFDVVVALKSALKSSMAELSDEDALKVAAAFDSWIEKFDSNDQAVAIEEAVAGERLWYDSKLYKVITTHMPQRGWTPDHTPALYREVSVEEIPEWVQPIDAQSAYHLGDRVKHSGSTWESLVETNVWEPSESVPTLWKILLV